jgi:RHS repeat-associated protein
MDGTTANSAESSYYRARYYDPSAGRFLNEDSIRFDAGVNFYAYVGNAPGQWADPYGACPPRKICGLKKAPEYGVSGTVPGGTAFGWGAEFLNDDTHDPKCCEVRQMVSWDRGPAPHRGFQPPEDQPNHYYEDRTPDNLRYGRRTGPSSPGNQASNDYHGDGYTGWDKPDIHHHVTLRFRLIVVDVCNGEKTIYTSKEISDVF